MTTPNELKAALTDVRRAYRLVYAYQRRVFDLAGAIAEPLEAAGFEFEHWEPTLFATPGKSFYKPDKWAWDFLPAYSFRSTWNRFRPSDVRRASLTIVADTGFEKKRAEPDPADFVPPEKALSELWLNLWRSEVTPPWEKTVAALASAGEIADGQEHKLDVGGVACQFRRLRVDLSDLLEEATVDKRLLQPVRQWLSGT
jgi:hypothetical protein